MTHDDAGEALRVQARALWQRVETIHAVTYFASESTAASSEVGVRGFWRTYFGFRAAPFGRCSAATVTSAFYGFSPAFVERAVPAIWGLADPATFLTIRASSAAAALRRLAPGVEQLANEPSVIQQLEVAAFATATAGRPMYAANRTVEPSADPVERLWQACTTLREQRGDGHVAALVTVGLVPPEADLLRLAVTGTADEVLRESRGWTDEAWAEARVRLAQRGLTDGQGATGLGNALRDDVERITDALAASALAVLTAEQRHELVSRLTPVATTIADSGLIPFPNPIGLDHTKDSRRRLAGRANTRT